MNKIDFRNNSIESVEDIFIKNNFNKVKINNFKKALRIQQIDSIQKIKGVRDLNSIIELLPFQPLNLIKSIRDKDKNEKFIFETFDNYHIESVLMPFKKNISICVSVQVGCKLGCILCNTGRMGFKRNLYTHEMLEQVRHIYQSRIFPMHLSCISFMGMGEPFDNLENCMNALNWINSTWGWQVSRERVTFSTSGCISFKKIFTYKKLPNLAVSIHTANDDKRKVLMPKSKISLKKLKEYMLDYIKIFDNQISIEYCLIKDFNDSYEDAMSLVNYLKGIPCKVNLLNYNRIEGSEFEPVDLKHIDYFKSILKKNNIPVIYRKSLGVEIGAGCGQLGERN